jgi:hypothetical protein
VATRGAVASLNNAIRGPRALGQYDRQAGGQERAEQQSPEGRSDAELEHTRHCCVADRHWIQDAHRFASL